MVARRQAAQPHSLWSSESLLLSSRPASSPMLPHADTHSRIEHFASRYHQVWGREILRSLRGKGFSVRAKSMESGPGDVHREVCGSQRGPTPRGGWGSPQS